MLANTTNTTATFMPIREHISHGWWRHIVDKYSCTIIYTMNFSCIVMCQTQVSLAFPQLRSRTRMHTHTHTHTHTPKHSVIHTTCIDITASTQKNKIQPTNPYTIYIRRIPIGHVKDPEYPKSSFGWCPSCSLYHIQDSRQSVPPVPDIARHTECSYRGTVGYQKRHHKLEAGSVRCSCHTLTLIVRVS